MDGLIAGSRGGKTTSMDGRAYRWQLRWEDNIQGCMGLSLTVEVGRQHPRMDGLIADSRGGENNIQGWTGLSVAVEVGRQYPRMHGLIADSRGGKTTSKDGQAYRWQ